MRPKQEQIDQLMRILENIEADQLKIEAGEFVIYMREGGIETYRLEPVNEIKERFSKQKAKKEKKGEEIFTITAPSAGVFYRRPDPDSPPYVEVGSIVEPGDTLALIEVMKSFAPIVSEVKGEVVEILVEDGAAVEYGQTLFLIKRTE